MFGGYSMGINTAALNPSRWLRVFGIDSENPDQIEIVNRAATVEDELVQEYAMWLENSFNRVVRDNRRVTDETIRRAIRSYIATKRIVAEREYDFVAIKCQPELSDGFVNQCLSQTLLNDPYDAEGEKHPICCSCEADSNGALTMHILKHLSGGKPALFADAVTFDDEQNAVICQNCGGAATWFADLNTEDSDKLKKVDIVPNVQGQAGGPAFNYYGAAAGDMTWARLAQTEENYIMHIVKGELIDVGDAFRQFLMKWPTVAVKTKKDTRALMEEYPSQHVHIVAADVVEELKAFCRIAGFSFEIHE
jgi:L-fucose isomerase